MSRHSDATEREREARESVETYVLLGDNDDDFTRGTLDAYRAAVRARLLADVIAVVEDGVLCADDPNHDGGEHRCHYCVDADTRIAILTRLRAMEQGA